MTPQEREVVRQYFDNVRAFQVDIMRPLFPDVVYGHDWHLPSFPGLDIPQLDYGVIDPEGLEDDEDLLRYLPAEAEAERLSVAELKKDNANLRREITLAKKDAPERPVPPPSEELIERRVAVATKALEREHNEHIRNLENAIAFYMRAMTKTGKHLAKAATELGVEIDVPARRHARLDGNGRSSPRASDEHGGGSPKVSEGENHSSASRRDRTPDRTSSVLPSTNGAEPLEGIRKGARRILKELARRHPLAWTKAQVAQLTGYTASGGTFTAYIGDLKRSGGYLHCSF